MQTSCAQKHTSLADKTRRSLQSGLSLLAVASVLPVLSVFARHTVLAVLPGYTVRTGTSGHTVQPGFAGHAVATVQAGATRHTLRTTRPGDALAARRTRHADVAAIALLAGDAGRSDRPGRTVVFGGGAEPGDRFVLWAF